MAIAVIDYKKGNLFSVQRWMAAAGYETHITSDPETIEQADAVILPGVGSFKDAACTMEALGEMEAIRRVLQQGRPFLGICLGAQLLVAKGDEGCEPGQWCNGLGVFKGHCERLNDTCEDGTKVKIPHVGWNALDFEGTQPCPLFDEVPQGSYFYFTHSYKLVPDDKSAVAAYTTHAERFSVALAADNIFGTQFHPEKSSDIGLVVARNFGRIVYPGR